MNFYAKLEEALFSADINTKELIVDSLIEYLKKDDAILKKSKPKIWESPSYSKICKIVSPKELPKRRDFNNIDSLRALVHSIAHIEFSAVDLAIDAVYRFQDMPKEYKLDWLIVAQDEIRHFKMLDNILKELDIFYGALPVHKGLFEMAYKTSNNLVDRMAIIPRYFEASGLDVNPKIINKLKAHKNNLIVSKIIDALDIIYIEEIEHVRKGDKWFKYLCKIEDSEPQKRYLDIINRYNLKGRAEQFNIDARKKAGFSCEELITLGAKECK